MNPWPAAIFFDFDGVIVDSEPIHFAALKEILASEQIEIDEQEYYQELIGFDDRGAIAHIFQKRGRPLEPATLRRVAEQKMAATQKRIEGRQYSALPGVEALVRGLWRHYPLAICSGALRAEIELMLDGVNLRECFPTIVAAEDVSVGKPDPMGYLLTAKKVRQRTGLNFTPEDCLVIEDAPSVIRSVRAEGFQTLGVATSYPIEKLNDAHFVVSQLEPSEVLEQIPGLKVGL